MSIANDKTHWVMFNYKLLNHQSVDNLFENASTQLPCSQNQSSWSHGPSIDYLIMLTYQSKMVIHGWWSVTYLFTYWMMIYLIVDIYGWFTYQKWWCSIGTKGSPFKMTQRNAENDMIPQMGGVTPIAGCFRIYTTPMKMDDWLVLSTPLKNMSSSVGMMKFPIFLGK